MTDWRPRGASITQTISTKEPELIGLETGTLNQIVFASESSAETIKISFEIQADTPKNYKQFIYRKEGTLSSVSGVEDGLEKKVLRFTAYGSNPDLVEVYVNGVKKEKGTGPDEYQIYDGTSSSSAPPNTIAFNTSLSSQNSTQIDVIVSKVVAAKTIELTFNRNSQNTTRTGSYENVSHVNKFEAGTWKRYNLYTLDLTGSEVPLNTIMRPQSATGYFLLARKPYTQLDRYTTLLVPVSGWSDTDFIKYYVENEVNTLRVTDTAISTVFPPLRFGKFSVENTIKTAVAGVEEQLVVDGEVIVGPDS